MRHPGGVQTTAIAAASVKSVTPTVTVAPTTMTTTTTTSTVTETTPPRAAVTEHVAAGWRHHRGRRSGVAVAAAVRGVRHRQAHLRSYHKLEGTTGGHSVAPTRCQSPVTRRRRRRRRPMRVRLMTRMMTTTMAVTASDLRRRRRRHLGVSCRTDPLSDAVLAAAVAVARTCLARAVVVVVVVAAVVVAVVVPAEALVAGTKCTGRVRWSPCPATPTCTHMSHSRRRCRCPMRRHTVWPRVEAAAAATSLAHYQSESLCRHMAAATTTTTAMAMAMAMSLTMTQAAAATWRQ